MALRVLESARIGAPMQTFRADARRPPPGRWISGHADAWGLGERLTAALEGIERSRRKAVWPALDDRGNLLNFAQCEFGHNLK